MNGKTQIVREHDLCIEDISDLLTPPSVTISETVFKQVVLPYYTNRTQPVVDALITLIRNRWHCSFKVHEDGNPNKLLFEMPAIISDIDALGDYAGSVAADVDKYMVKVKRAEERGIPGEISNARDAINTVKITTDMSDAIKIIRILIRYGKIPTTIYEKLREMRKRDPSNIEVVEKKESVGIVDEWD